MGSAERIQNIGDTPAYRGNVARALATAVHLGHRHVFEDASGVESGQCIVHPMLVLRREMPVDERQFFLAHHGSSVSRVSGTLDARLSRESASVIRRHRRRSPDGSCPPERGRSWKISRTLSSGSSVTTGIVGRSCFRTATRNARRSAAPPGSLATTVLARALAIPSFEALYRSGSHPSTGRHHRGWDPAISLACDRVKWAGNRGAAPAKHKVPVRSPVTRSQEVAR